MAEAAEDDVAIAPREIAEDDRLVRLAVKCVRVSERVWYNLELMLSESPAHAPPKCELETRQRTHDDRVDVLRVKMRVVEDGRVGRLFEWVAMLVLLERVRPRRFGLVQRARRRIVIDDLYAVPPRASRKCLGGDLDSRR